MNKKQLMKILESRMKSSDKYPAFLTMKEGDEILGKIVDIKQLFGKQRYDLQDMSGKEWTLPGHAVLSRLLTEQNVAVGDYVLIRHGGTVPTRQGNPMNMYSLGKISKGELAELGGLKKKEKSIKKESKKGGKWKEVEEYLHELYGFYDELTKEQLDNFINKVKNFDVNVDDVIDKYMTVKGGKVRLK